MAICLLANAADEEITRGNVPCINLDSSDGSVDIAVNGDKCEFAGLDELRESPRYLLSALNSSSKVIQG